jgi:hypothetical protein
MREKFVSKSVGENGDGLDVRRVVFLFRLHEGTKLENVKLNILHTCFPVALGGINN